MTQKTYQHIATAALLLLLFAGSVQAQTVSAPRMLSYQGVLSSTGTAGNDTAGNRLLKVTLYGDANGTTKLWQSTMNTPVDANGVFNCMLGSVDNPLPPPAMMDRAIWLGVSIDNAPELRPLSEVSASAYAINVADSSITTVKIAEGAVTWDKMGTDYVPYIRVNGDKVTTGHNPINFTGSEGLVVDYDSLSMSVIVHPDTSLQATNKSSGIKALNAVNGAMNVSWGFNDFLGGGLRNTIDAPNPSNGLENTLAGGDSNWIGKNSDHNFIGGGQLNTIWRSSASGATIDHNTIGGGSGNHIANVNNDSTRTADFIGGGTGNAINSSNSTIGGGDSNAIVNPINYSFIGGGQSNTITNQTADGRNPPWEATPWHVIGGGFGNQIVVDITTEAQEGTWGAQTIAGGQNNTLCGPWGFVGGGQNNIISSQNPTADDNNAASVAWDVVTGGSGNSIDTFSNYSDIGGGWGNHIGGKFTDSIHADRNVVGGGYYNTILKVRDGVIAGGNGNTLFPSGITSSGDCAAIGGGYLNKSFYQFSNIPGGLGLTTDAEAQTVIGFGNIEAGSGHLAYWAGFPPNDDRVFEIGSPLFTGGNWVSSNAFEVSYSGHSIVYHTNGSSYPTGTPAVYQGATYVESPVYAWGEVQASGTPSGTSNFGISQVIPLWPTYTSTQGTYLVTLCPANPHGGPAPDISEASITVTIDNDYTTDITSLPPIPPQAPVQQALVAKPIPDSLILAIGGTLSNPDTSTSGNSGQGGSPNSPQQPPSPPVESCGYATASVIGVLGASYPNSFIVRTFIASGGENICNQQPLAFFFKVCHR